MAATFRILSQKIGEGALKHGIEVLRLQQLLKLNGLVIGTTGRWHSETSDALVAYQKKVGVANMNAAFWQENPKPLQPWIAPNDPILFDLAYGAKVLIRLAPGGRTYRHGLAFEDVHSWCEHEHVPFDLVSRAVWGFDGYSTWAIVTSTNTDFGQAAFAMDVPRALNCTLYVNLMMSVWKQGNAHRFPFDASVKTAGGTTHFANERYRYPILGQFSDASDVRTLTSKAPRSLYCLEYGSESVYHLALLYGGRVHECNYGPTRDVHSVTLDQWVSTHPGGWVLGPAPP
jgi:hypothetical protein